MNASSMAAARGLLVEEKTQRRQRGFQNTIEVTIANDGREFTLEGTVGQDGVPRIISLDGMSRKRRSKARCF